MKKALEVEPKKNTGRWCLANPNLTLGRSWKMHVYAISLHKKCLGSRTKKKVLGMIHDHESFMNYPA